MGASFGSLAGGCASSHGTVLEAAASLQPPPPTALHTQGAPSCASDRGTLLLRGCQLLPARPDRGAALQRARWDKWGCARALPSPGPLAEAPCGAQPLTAGPQGWTACPWTCLAWWTSVTTSTRSWPCASARTSRARTPSSRTSTASRCASSPGRDGSCPRGQCFAPQPLTPVPRQIQPRRYQQKLPLQANFYPMPAMAYIQDMQSRLTLHTAQALGVSSLSSGEPGPGAVALGGSGGCWRLLTPGARGPLSAGQLEVILDRRLMQDDNRGLGQGLKDNKRTCNRFRLLLERRATANKVCGLGAPRDFGGQEQRCCGAEPSPASGRWGTVAHAEPRVQPGAGCPPCTSWPSRPPRWHCRGMGPWPERGVCVGRAGLRSGVCPACGGMEPS